MTTDDTDTQVRDAAKEFKERWNADASFKETYEKNPIATLRSLGMPDVAITDCLRETGFGEEDVSGFLAMNPALLGGGFGGLSAGPSAKLGAPVSPRGSLSGPGSLMDCDRTCGFSCFVTA